MAYVGEYPILMHIMNYYAGYGHREFIVCLGYLGRVIKDFFLNLDKHTAHLSVGTDTHGTRQITYHRSLPSDWVVHLVETGEHTLTATRIARAAKFIRGSHFCVTYGDGLTNLPLDKELEFHLSHGKIGTVGAVHPPARFGNLEIDPSGLVTKFQEKRPLQHDLINGGYFFFKRDFLDRISATENESLESRPLVDLTDAAELHAFRHEGFWQCMDTLRDLEVLREMYERGRAPWCLT